MRIARGDRAGHTVGKRSARADRRGGSSGQRHWAERGTTSRILSPLGSPRGSHASRIRAIVAPATKRKSANKVGIGIFLPPSPWIDGPSATLLGKSISAALTQGAELTSFIDCRGLSPGKVPRTPPTVRETKEMLAQLLMHGMESKQWL